MPPVAPAQARTQAPAARPPTQQPAPRRARSTRSLQERRDAAAARRAAAQASRAGTLPEAIERLEREQARHEAARARASTAPKAARRPTSPAATAAHTHPGPEPTAARTHRAPQATAAPAHPAPQATAAPTRPASQATAAPTRPRSQATAGRTRPTSQATAAPSRPDPHDAAQRAAPQRAQPVAGQLLQGYGAAGENGLPARGITWQAAPGAHVASPCTGRVAFAGPFRSYGRMVIVDCGEQQHVVLAGLGQVTVTPGRRVRAGEAVGQLAAPPGGERQTLYCELRLRGQPADPIPWLAGRGSRLAQD